MHPDQSARLAERLLARSVVADTGCRRWTGTHWRNGYGQVYANRRTRRVHIVAHEIWIGPVPEGYDVDHVYARGCRYRDCIEPSHLEAVTHAENTRRVAELITHCPQGHEYTPDNIKWIPKPDRPSRSRRCKRCANDGRNAWRARKRAESKGDVEKAVRAQLGEDENHG